MDTRGARAGAVHRDERTRRHVTGRPGLIVRFQPIDDKAAIGVVHQTGLIDDVFKAAATKVTVRHVRSPDQMLSQRLERRPGRIGVAPEGSGTVRPPLLAPACACHLREAAAIRADRG